MKVKSILAIVLACALWNIGYCQEIELNKKALQKIFRQNAKGKTYKNLRGWAISAQESHKSDYSVWMCSSLDSSYHLSDTLVMYNYRYAYFEIGGETKEWHFIGKKVGISTGKYNIEPPRSSTLLMDYKIKVKRNSNKGLELQIIRNKEVVERFEVLTLRKEYYKNDNEIPMYVMVLKRLSSSSK